jgi:hypothetical protein
MRAMIAGILATALYTLVIATLISMTMPTQARVEAYIDAAHPASTSMAPVVDGLLAG